MTSQSLPRKFQQHGLAPRLNPCRMTLQSFVPSGEALTQITRSRGYQSQKLYGFAGTAPSRERDGINLACGSAETRSRLPTIAWRRGKMCRAFQFVAQSQEGNNRGCVTSRGGVESVGHALNTRTAGEALRWGTPSTRSHSLQDGLPPGAEGPQMPGRPGPRDTVSLRVDSRWDFPDGRDRKACCPPQSRPFPHGTGNESVRPMVLRACVGGVSCRHWNRFRFYLPQKCGAPACPMVHGGAPLFTPAPRAAFGRGKQLSIGPLQPASKSASPNTGWLAARSTKLESSHLFDCSIELHSPDWPVGPQKNRVRCAEAGLGADEAQGRSISGDRTAERFPGTATEGRVCPLNLSLPVTGRRDAHQSRSESRGLSRGAMAASWVDPASRVVAAPSAGARTTGIPAAVGRRKMLHPDSGSCHQKPRGSQRGRTKTPGADTARPYIGSFNTRMCVTGRRDGHQIPAGGYPAHSRGRRETRKSDPRIDLAAEGDPVGASVFLDFIQRELYSMAYVSNFPKPVSDRLGEVQRQVERAAEFVAGFNASNAKPAAGT